MGEGMDLRCFGEFYFGYRILCGLFPGLGLGCGLVSWDKRLWFSLVCFRAIV